MKSETIFIQQYPKYDYEVRTEMVIYPDNVEPIQVKRAYTVSSAYIGDPQTATFLCKEKGIKPELIDSEHSVCSIGFCEAEQKWYGWSHRAIFGFGTGSQVKKGDCAYTPSSVEELHEEFEENGKLCEETEIEEHTIKTGRGRWTAKTLDDAKQMAIDFANGVA